MLDISLELWIEVYSYEAQLPINPKVRVSLLQHLMFKATLSAAFKRNGLLIFTEHLIYNFDLLVFWSCFWNISISEI